MIYLDNAATSPVRRAVLERMWPYLTEEFGNPSSTHEYGRQAALALTHARERVARVLGCRAAEVVFTSGGTESDNLAIIGVSLATPRGRHIVTTPIEHEAVIESCSYLQRQHGFEVTMVDVDTDGLVDADELGRALRPDTTLVSVMYANNEVGTVQPIRRIAALAGAVGARMHTDAVQAAGWLPLDVAALGVDALAISGHKLGAPKGIGALYLRRGMSVEATLHGGGQERGRRSGTENVPGAVGLAEALELAEAARPGSADRIAELRNAFIDRVLAEVPGARLTGHHRLRLPANASFCFPGTSGEAVLLDLERRGIICSSGSACAAGSDEPSHVLVAMGLDAELAQTAVRFTLSETTTADDLAATVAALADSVAGLSGHPSAAS
ncbi:cysteine desulfurase family protein [Marisediminicola antarctica]|uniref:cysteine desulfurase n=1 Tax=Marisediminicola antarctica TaxID=674079 RepID=A0A7L5AL23_9MICO|nr:cysteine desulfurase family protein [Marisediminicola antarctica]QHO69831.1 cysteine desulfurase [Marisediminicola antarctica]